MAQKHPDKKIELWAQDEARLGLQPIVRRVWALKGCRPQACHRRSYQWIYAYGFFQPTTGESFWLLLPSVNTELMSLALEHWVAQVDPQQQKILVLLVDQAGWHLSKKLKVPANVILHYLPAYTPELQPAECVWPLLREVVANRFIGHYQQLTGLLSQRCRWLMEHPQIVATRTAWKWLKDAQNVAQSL